MSALPPAVSELYDLQRDAEETSNVAAQPPDIVHWLEGLAEQCRDDLGNSLNGRKSPGQREPGREPAAPAR